MSAFLDSPLKIIHSYVSKINVTAKVTTLKMFLKAIARNIIILSQVTLEACTVILSMIKFIIGIDGDWVVMKAGHHQR